MRIALVIGASRGIGREYVAQLLAGGWKVYATARDDAALAELRGAGAEAIKLDVASAESIVALAWQINGVKFDLVIYVAGLYGPNTGAVAVPTAADFDAVMHTNVLGAMQLMPTVAPAVAAAHGRFVFVTSGMGSIGEATSSTGWVYRASKAALNMTVKTAAFDYPDATLIAMCPGWVRTDMGGPNASLTAQKSVSDQLAVIASLTQDDSGSYRNHAGRHLAW